MGATPDTTKGAVLLEDATGFTDCLLLGIENHLLIMYICLFNYIDIFSGKPIMAALVVWVLEIIVRFLRIHYGDQNIAQKSMLDSKFLI